MKTFTILSQGLATPEHCIDQKEAAQYAIEYICHTDEQRRLLPALYRMSGVKRRYTVLLEENGNGKPEQAFFPKSEDEHDRGPSLAERMVKYEYEAPRLAIQSSRQALEASGVAPDEITHLITVSCSGFGAPGVDITLIRDLGLRPTVQRAHVGFMGCHGALNGLRVARGIAESDENARVLICAVEVCSLHYHYGWNKEQVVANSLFADGSAAIVGTATNGEDKDAWKIAATGSCLIPDSEDAMTWHIRNNGFEMSLSPKVPELICAHLKAWMTEWLGEHGYTLGGIQSWAVHPGGPRIVSSVQKALDLEKDAVEVSKSVLRDYGNMSSPTILFIVNRLREQNAPRPCVAIAFGPGLMAEAVLFD